MEKQNRAKKGEFVSMVWFGYSVLVSGFELRASPIYADRIRIRGKARSDPGVRSTYLTTKHFVPDYQARSGPDFALALLQRGYCWRHVGLCQWRGQAGGLASSGGMAVIRNWA